MILKYHYMAHSEHKCSTELKLQNNMFPKAKHDSKGTVRRIYSAEQRDWVKSGGVMRSVSQTDSQAHHHSFEYIKLGIRFRYHRFQLCYVIKNILFQRQKTTRKHRAWFKKAQTMPKTDLQQKHHHRPPWAGWFLGLRLDNKQLTICNFPASL